MVELQLEKVGINREDKIITICSKNPIVAFSEEKIIEVSKKLALSEHRSLPVVNKKMQLVGIVSITDILNFLFSEGDMNSPIVSIMSREVVSCESNETIEFVLQKMKISKRGRLPVISSKRVVGVISETDFILATKEFSSFERFSIEDVMIKRPFFVLPSFSIREVARTMVNGKYRRLPVVENGNLVGYITSTSLFKHLVNNSFSEDSLNQKISEIMTGNPIVVLRSESLANVLRIMKEKKISSMLVVDEKNRLEGIFTERDYINLLV